MKVIVDSIVALEPRGEIEYGEPRAEVVPEYLVCHRPHKSDLALEVAHVRCASPLARHDRLGTLYVLAVT